jgi:hypothetical protein
MICWDLMCPNVTVQRLNCFNIFPSSIWCLRNFPI